MSPQTKAPEPPPAKGPVLAGDAQAPTPPAQPGQTTEQPSRLPRDRDLPRGVQMVSIAFFFFASITVVAIALTRIFGRRSDRAALSPDRAVLPPEVTDRLTRIEQAVDGIVLEVERVAEGQRFTTKLLAERGTPAALPSQEAR